MLKWGGKGLLAVFLAVLVLAASHKDFRPSTLDLTVNPYRYSLVRWEVSHFLDKWVHKLADLMPWTSEPSRQERIDQVKAFFDLGQRQRELEGRLLPQASGTGGPVSPDQVQVLSTELETIVKQRERIRSTVEETIESEISAVLSQEGFASRIGLIFPPVDAVYSSSPGVLILSPRDRIQRLDTILMKPGLNDETRDRIENRILRQENLAALVESSGGVAAFPSVVSESVGLHQAMVITAHEWLHHWFFFQPLGQHFWDNTQMITLNETAATLGGQAIGDRAFTAMTGQQVIREPQPRSAEEKDAFDFNAAMRETRLRTEELLAEGKIEKAEAYMEERRQLMAANGHFIRKINQAFFAFHESYATSAASISAIDEQLRKLRGSTDSLEDFIKTVATFSKYQDFLDHLDQLGIKTPKHRLYAAVDAPMGLRPISPPSPYSYGRVVHSRFR